MPRSFHSTLRFSVSFLAGKSIPLEVTSGCETNCQTQLRRFFEQEQISVNDRRAIRNYVVTVQEGERMANVAKRFMRLIDTMTTDHLLLAFIY